MNSPCRIAASRKHHSRSTGSVSCLRGGFAVLLAASQIILAGCCTTVPDTDSVALTIFLRLFAGSDEGISDDVRPGLKLVLGLDETSDQPSLQVGVRDAGGIARIRVLAVGAELTERTTTAFSTSTRIIGGLHSEFAVWDGRRDCARDRVNAVFNVRPGPGFFDHPFRRSPAIGIQVFAEDFAGNTLGRIQLTAADVESLFCFPGSIRVPRNPTPSVHFVHRGHGVVVI